MLAIAINVNVVWLPLIVVLSAFTGFILRSAQIKKSTKRIQSLENEMLKNHAEILKLNKEIAELRSNIPNKTRIVSMKDKENPPVDDNENADSLKKKRFQ